MLEFGREVSASIVHNSDHWDMANCLGVVPLGVNVMAVNIIFKMGLGNVARRGRHVRNHVEFLALRIAALLLLIIDSGK